jgi:dTDP-4-dehydrorhamnose reductase
VNKAWEQKGDKNGLAYQVNVVGTQNIVNAAEATGKRLLHVSTAFVFDGKKKEKYVETDATGPIEWYGETKAIAEEIVMNSDLDWTIFRIDQPFRADPFKRPDTAHRVIQGLVAGTLYPQFTDHFFGPTWIDDFARILDWALGTKTPGVFHAASGESWTDYDFAEAIRRELKLPGEVRRGSIVEYLKTAQRPYHLNTALSCEKVVNASSLKFCSVLEALSLVVQK